MYSGSSSVFAHAPTGNKKIGCRDCNKFQMFHKEKINSCSDAATYGGSENPISAFEWICYLSVIYLKWKLQHSRQMIQVGVCIISELHGNIGVFITVTSCSPRITRI